MFGTRLSYRVLQFRKQESKDPSIALEAIAVSKDRELPLGLASVVSLSGFSCLYCVGSFYSSVLLVAII
jgi:hypothetical protein